MQVPSPVQRLLIPAFQKAEIDLWVKREDLIHPSVSGNKWRKLKYNLQEARLQKKATVLTFGGAYSNHLYAVAAAGKELGFSTIGLVRGERIEPLNPTLTFAREQGMVLHFLTRGDYSQKENVLPKLEIERNEVYILPEGGTNELALPGCAEIGVEIQAQFKKLPDYICLCCGTGGTMAGLIQGMKGKSKILGFSVLKGDFHQKLIQGLLAKKEKSKELDILNNWLVHTDYHLGGYAKFKPELIDFINHYKSDFQLPLDPVYTAKLFWGLTDLAQKQYFEKGSTVLAIHTGGLQGVAGFNQRFGDLILE